MTHAEIDAMPAGREMDALVAERVMGLVIHKAGDLDLGWEQKGGPTPPEWHMRGIEKDVLMVERVPPPGYYRYIGIPHYSTDIAAAWELVEQLRKLGWFILFGNNGHNRGDPANPIWWANFYQQDMKKFWAGDRNKYGESSHERGGTAPLAICRAALKAAAK